MKQRWVVKAGSNLVCTGGPILLRAWMSQVAALRKKHGVEVIWVTSGAIASAAERAGIRKRKKLSEKQALSAIGQPIVMDLYNLALHAEGVLGAQILLTYDDLANRVRRKNFENTVEKLLEWKVLPILNENDAVATQEIQFGDNDSLSAKVACVTGADRLVILTDVEGLNSADPRKDSSAKLIPFLPRVTDAILRGVKSGGGTSRGTGGMFSKLRAAREAAKAGVITHLAAGDQPSVLLKIAEGQRVGTRIGGPHGK
jgi:glutamate 5-kinase